MKATDELMTEHRAIERMLAIMDVAAQRLREGRPVRPQMLREAVDFVRNFADKCHHGKEEENLFPRMEAAGVPREGGPLGVMLFEHEEGREHIAAIADEIDAYERGDATAAPRIADNARGYVDLLRQHIAKEEQVLFPMADRVLGQDDQRALEERFERLETEVMGPGVHERYHELLNDLEREMGLATA
jgi:hemerythrin-like domain-containing protein